MISNCICQGWFWAQHNQYNIVIDLYEESAGIVEYKNPYSGQNMTILDAVEKVKDFIG